MSSQKDLDLEHFRKEWQKEINVKKEKLKDTASSSNTGLGAKIDIQYDNHASSVTSLIEAHSPIDSDIHDDDNRDSFFPSSSSESTKVPVYNYNESTDSSEYYPFRILTQFLNEAPKKGKMCQRWNDLEERSSCDTYSKRKYFQSPSSHQRSESKAPKLDSLVAKSLNQKTDKNTRMLDLFLADLDEVNEIPFFDSSLPREVAVNIFQYLDMKSLCSCAQVSSSWRSLADDELLWCTICHQLGHEEETRVGDLSDWKGRVRDFIEAKQLLESNWKARVGRPYNLCYAKGGVLCAIHSFESTIVAGYTNCSVKTWNTLSGDSCTYHASNTSMVIDETANDLGRIPNEIKHLKTTAHITAASFRHGFIDIWSNDLGTDPIHTVVFNRPDVSSLSLQDIDRNHSVMAASQNTRVHVGVIDEEKGRILADFNMKNPVSNLQWLDGNYFGNSTVCLLVSTTDSVWLKDFDPQSDTFTVPNLSANDLNFKEIHSIAMAPVTFTAVRPKTAEVGVGFNMITGPSVQIKVNVYDVIVGKLKASMKGHTWLISSIHMPQGLPNQLVTGSGDRKVRLFDAQAQNTPVLTLAGHSAKVTSVQMDEIKVVSGDEAGFVCVWDQRMGRKLWDLHNRHPVQYCHFHGRLLIIGNVPYEKFSEDDEFESVSSLRYRGTVQFYDFLANQQRAGIPEICLSSYNEPEASVSNLGLTVPYDSF